jgi:uncharacterized protein
MLTADLVRPRLRCTAGELTIALLDEHRRSWLQTASELIALLRRQVGHTQAEWERAVETYAGPRVDYVVVRGLAKVLSDAATFTPPPLLLPPAVLRERLFAHGPVFPTPQLFDPRTRDAVMASVAAELGLGAEQVAAMLFADRPAASILQDAGPPWTPIGLLARYNLELARGVLYWASRLHLEVHGSYKDLWKYLKLFKLMFWARALPGGGYAIDLDGPISPFVHATTRYGRQFAAFLPALLLCAQWRLVADVRPPQLGTPATYRLDYTGPLRTHFARSGPFDSRLEADFAREFAEKFGGRRGPWLLSREDEVLLLGDTVMIPDFALTHKRLGHRVLIELVGFWHPDYVRRKVEKVRAAHCHHLLLLVYERVNLAAERLRDVPGEVVYFKQKPVLKEVMGAVQALAERVYGVAAKQ